MEGEVTELATPGVWEARVAAVNQLLRQRRDALAALTTELASHSALLAQQRALFNAHYDTWDTPQAAVPELEAPPVLVTVRSGALEGVLDIRSGLVTAAGAPLTWEEFERRAAEWVWVGGEAVPREQWAAARADPAQLAAFAEACRQRDTPAGK